MASKNEVSVDISLEEKAALKALTALTKEFKSTEQGATKSIGKIDIAVGTLAGNLAANLAGKAISSVVSGFRSMINIGRESIAASARQEDAVNALNAALRQNGNFSEQASQDLQSFASQLQQITRFGDEATLEQLAFAQSMGATVNQSKAIVSAAADMSEALGMDFNSAVRNITKTLGGLKGELGESIPELGALTKEQLLAGKAIDLVAEKFRGQAAAATQTFSGALQQTSNIIGDTQESLGSLITTSPQVVGAIKGVGEIFTFVGKAINDNKQSIQDFASNAIGNILIGGVEMGVDAFILFNEAITTTNEFFDFLTDRSNAAVQGILSFAQGTIDAAASVKEFFGADTSGLDALSEKLKQQNEFLEAGRNKTLELMQVRREENEALKAQAEEFKEFSVTTLQERLAAENEVKAAAREADLNNKRENKEKEKELELTNAAAILKVQTDYTQKELKLLQAERSTFQYESKQKVSIAQNTANLINAVAGEQTKAAFLISKVAAAGQVLISDSQARAAAMTAAATASIPAAVGGPGAAAAAYSATLAKYNAAISINTGLALATIAAQTIQGFAQGGFVGGAQGASMGGDNRLATVRDGELVLTADDQEELLNGIRGGGMGGDIVIEIDGREIARAVRDQRQQGFAL